MPVPVVAANWKMHTTVREALGLASALREPLDRIHGVEKVLCPPFVSLAPVKAVLDGSSVRLGAQNMHYEEKGAYTGEISPPMLAELCQYVILGHSERRRLFHESDELVNHKVKAALRAGLKPILCLGEGLAEREAGQADEVVARQARLALQGVSLADGLVIAYEPIWAIGTGKAATGPDANATVSTIRRTLVEVFGRGVADEIPLLYGGSVTPENVQEFVREPQIHGALVGGASLNAEGFTRMVEYVARLKGSGR